MDFASLEELRRLVAQKRGCSISDVEDLVSKKRKEFAELLSGESALKIVAKESGVEVVEEEVLLQFQSLESIGQVDVPVNVFIRVLNVFAPREFKTEKRRGRVCNVSVSDSSKRANLVLWDKDVDLVESGKIERDDLIEVAGAKVKGVDPLELTASFLTGLNVLKEDELDGLNKERALGIPKAVVVVKKLGEVTESDSEFDVFARVLKTGVVSEFAKRDGRVGKVGSLIVSDGTKKLRVTLWDKNADLVDRTKVGDAIKVESGYAKLGRDNDLEVHVGWRGRVVLHPKKHDLAEKETLWKESYKTCSLSELKENDECIVNVRLKSLENARVVLKCKKCNASMNESVCASCGSIEYKKIIVVNAILEDSNGSLKTVFFSREALDLLNLKSLTVDASTVLDLKGEYLIGNELVLVLSGKKNLNNELEAVCRHVISSGKKEEVQAIA